MPKKKEPSKERAKGNLLYDDLDSLPAYKRYERRNSLRRRIKARTCELCGKTDCDIVMHQVKRLKDLKGSNDWERAMININRKTLAVCQVCYDKIHPAAKNDRRLVPGEPDTLRGVRPVREGVM